jgi:hypothetical protein
MNRDESPSRVQRSPVRSPDQAPFHPQSPIRKQLVKDLTSYYNLLYETELLEQDSGKPAPKTRINSTDQEVTYFNPQTGYERLELDLQVYAEDDARVSRLEELKALMKSELQYIDLGHPIDPTSTDYESAVTGYPSFMEHPHASSHNFHCDYHYKDHTSPPIGEISQYRSDFQSVLQNLTAGTPTYYDIANLRNHLLTLRTKRNYLLKNANDEKLYDFHQRKGKEIRRRQYSAWLRERNNALFLSPQKFERVLISLGAMFRT